MPTSTYQHYLNLVHETKLVPEAIGGQVAITVPTEGTISDMAELGEVYRLFVMSERSIFGLVAEGCIDYYDDQADGGDVYGNAGKLCDMLAEALRRAQMFRDNICLNYNHTLSAGPGPGDDQR